MNEASRRPPGVRVSLRKDLKAHRTASIRSACTMLRLPWDATTKDETRAPYSHSIC
ncbi:hypothetical protein MAA8898_05112 [Maliponia aquimaris]|uniref:Uncharacterized protein n=1 Tax=Maliponia aquimaris TaxID=1673631 RepID=A0A238L7V0_9RHOB|nr:hypothetical protein MAA8898_05112 [Maliponia aquimaris]